MPSRGLSIDPSRPLDLQKIGTTVQMPVKWLEVWNQVARAQGVSKSRLICRILEEFAKENDIELPPYH